MENITEIVVGRIKALREQNNFTQQYVADQLEISQNAYFLIEKGLTKLTIDRLAQIAAFYKIDTVELISDPDNQRQRGTAHYQSSGTPPAMTPMERLLYEKNIQYLEDNVNRLYSLVEKLSHSLAAQSLSQNED